MKKTIILLYGPPGVGKLTVGKQLSTKTKFILFNGHQLADLVHSIFDFGTKEFVDTTNRLWLYLFEASIRSKNQGLIVSLVYGVQTLRGKEDDTFFRKVIRLAKKHKTNLYFVKLKCSDQTLYRRVQNPTRRKYGKLVSPALLKQIRQNYKVDRTIPFVKNTIVDNTYLTPKQAADRIITRLKIPIIREGY